MIEFALHNEAIYTAKKVFGTKKVIYDTETVYVDSPDFHTQLDDNAVYFLINEKLDTTTTAKIVIQSQSNFLATTKDAYSPTNFKSFRSYLKVKTFNYGTEFVPFALTFLKVTPYE